VKAEHLAQSDDWGTGPQIVEPARYVLGGFDLDPMSSPYWNRWTIKAERIYTAADSGLDPAKSWSGRKMINPAGTLVRQAWARAMAAQMEHGTYTAPSIWVGFNLEQLQDLQIIKPSRSRKSWTRTDQHPLSFATCVLAGRHPFLRQPWRCLEIEYQSPSCGWTGLPLEVKDAAGAVRDVLCRDCSSPHVAPDDDLAPIVGAQPTHGTYVTLLASDLPTIRRFRRAFSPLGHILATD
jgi:hypothetical protein